MGHLLFVRNTEGAEKKRLRRYQQEILLLGISDHHKQYAKFDASSGSPIPNKLTAITYCDGDLSQVDTIKTSIDLLVDNKVIANKQHASRLGVEQPADFAKVFKLIKNLLPSHTVKNIPAERCRMKAFMLDAFKEKLEYLNLPSNKRHCLIVFISTLSVMTTIACTVKNIQHGFIQAGIIDGDNLHFPVFNKILATCRRNPSIEEYKNIERNMDKIMCESCEFGQISEDIYEALDIVRDRDSMGREVLWDATIAQES